MSGGNGENFDMGGEEWADEQIYVGAVDEELTDKGYISPGLGDAVSSFRTSNWTLSIEHRLSGTSSPAV